MIIKPQDIVVALRLCSGAAPPSYAKLGEALGMSASEVHAAVRRLMDARLVGADAKEVQREAFRNFLIYGVPFAFPVHAKEITRGMPTAWAAPVLAGKIKAEGQLPPVWPDPNGKVQGVAVRPLYASVPGAARREPALYDLLALVDALRMGRARERNLAEKELSNRLKLHAAA